MFSRLGEFLNDWIILANVISKNGWGGGGGGVFFVQTTHDVSAVSERLYKIENYINSDCSVSNDTMNNYSYMNQGK